MNISNLLSKRNSIYGACAIWIILFHTFRRISMPYIPVVTNIIGIGNMAVDIFFFFSGLCLSLSARKHNYLENGWKGYYRNRFQRVLIPYFLIGIPFYLWAAFNETQGSIIKRILLFAGNLSSATFWIKGTQTTWFVYGIVVFYLLFPFLFQFIQKSNNRKQNSLLLVFIIFAVVSNYAPLLNNSIIVWARLPIFTIGAVVGVKERTSQNTNINKTLMIFSIIVLIGLGIITSTSELSKTFTIPQVYRLLLYIPLTLALLHILSTTGKENLFLERIGCLSLEVYLIHITLLHPLKYYGIIDAVGYWLYLILPVTSVLLAMLVGNIEKKIIRRLNPN